MYSVVLMAALTTGSASPEWGHWRGCSGCSVSYSHGCHRSVGCHGCYRSCSCSSYSCSYSGCHVAHGCFGCAVSYGCSGCYGCHSVYGCYSAWGCHGCSAFHATPVVVPKTPAPKSGGELPPPKKTGGDDSVRARLTIDVPAGAKLFVDDQPLTTTATQRSFVTPPLREGSAYFYDFRAEMERDGQKVTATRRVVIRGGETTQVTFPELQQPAAVTAQR